MLTLTEEVLERAGIAETAQKLEQLEAYRAGILEWNKKVNITKITDPEEFEIKHYLDAFSILESPEFVRAETVIDIRTGGGFPGVPLAIAAPEADFTLVDSTAKKLRIIDRLTAELGLRNVKTVHARAEDLARRPEHREQYDLCVTRAVANLNTLAEICLPFLCYGGALAAFKGSRAAEEVAAAGDAIYCLGGDIDRIEPVLPENGLSHHIIYILKEGETPDAYPRGQGKPFKEPLLKK